MYLTINSTAKGSVILGLMMNPKDCTEVLGYEITFHKSPRYEKYLFELDEHHRAKEKYDELCKEVE